MGRVDAWIGYCGGALLMNRNRHYDKNLLGRFWHESKLWIHLLIMACAAVTAWQVMAGDVQYNKSKNIDQDLRIEKLEEIASAQMAISARIEQKVDYIRDDVQQIKREVR